MMTAMISVLLAATLHFAGDSTLDDRSGWPYASWGSQLESYMKAGNRVHNVGRSGHSSRSFIDAGWWTEVIMNVEPGDFVAIAFGHNDQKRSTEHYRKHRWTDPKVAFKAIVRDWVRQIRAKGAEPVLMSPIRRAEYSADGQSLLDATHQSDGVCLGSYAQSMRELAEELGCEFVDMFELTRRELLRLGKAEGLKCYEISTGMRRGKDGEPSQDITHPITAGAECFARLFLADAVARRLKVAELFAPAAFVDSAPFPMSPIRQPEFRDCDYPITDFGAKPDGSKCTAAIAAAMARCSAEGGGRVVVPKGTWLTGAVHFRANCNLHLEAGAELQFTTDPADYPVVFTSWESIECYNYSPLIYAHELKNVAITGAGTLRAFAGEFDDTLWKRWVPNRGGAGQSRRRLYEWGADGVPVAERRVTDYPDSNLRPQFIQFNRCRNVRLEGVSIRNSPFWTVHLYHCDDVVCRGLDIRAHGSNTDGIDVEMTRNVLIENCKLDQGDDGFVLKSGRNEDARRLARATENVVIRNCTLDSDNGHTLLGIGSEISGGIKNVYLENCTARTCNKCIFIKTNRRRGAVVENVTVRNVRIDRARESLFGMFAGTLYEWTRFPDREVQRTQIRNIRLENVVAESARYDYYVKGDWERPFENISLSNVHAKKVQAPNEARNVVGLTVDGKAVEPDFPNGEPVAYYVGDAAAFEPTADLLQRCPGARRVVNLSVRGKDIKTMFDDKTFDDTVLMPYAPGDYVAYAYLGDDEDFRFEIEHNIRGRSGIPVAVGSRP